MQVNNMTRIIIMLEIVKPHLNFINKMLKRKASERLGAKGIEEVMNHPWLQDIDWNKMLTKKYPSPFLPNLENRNYDTVSESEYGQ